MVNLCSVKVFPKPQIQSQVVFLPLGNENKFTATKSIFSPFFIVVFLLFLGDFIVVFLPAEGEGQRAAFGEKNSNSGILWRFFLEIKGEEKPLKNPKKSHLFHFFASSRKILVSL